MKTAGILGGIGPESTVDYYRSIIAEYRRRRTDSSEPSILINSIDVGRLLGYVGRGELRELVAYLEPELARLARAGADFLVLASNTPHVVFDDLRRSATLPMISIVDAAANAVQASGARKVGLFGTRFTMSGSFYPDVFAARGVKVIRPGSDEQTYIHTAYIDELLKNVFRDETRARMLEIADAMRVRDGIEGVVLGGTELPLLLRQNEHNGVRLFDTTKIHVDAIVTELLTG
ncbi:MAG TPA: amino acid racemase [Thermoanaerobaculia bacterium]|nr:amino acid racemase [Thermoanaerobaculia bacterium]